MSKPIENHAKVYLHRNPGAEFWEIDPVTCDGYPLDGLAGGDEINDEHPEPDARIREDLNRVDVPGARELLRLLLVATEGEKIGDLLRAYHGWAGQRQDLSAEEEQGIAVDWYDSDRAAVDLAHELAAAFELLGIEATR